MGKVEEGAIVVLLVQDVREWWLGTREIRPEGVRMSLEVVKGRSVGKEGGGSIGCGCIVTDTCLRSVTCSFHHC